MELSDYRTVLLFLLYTLLSVSGLLLIKSAMPSGELSDWGSLGLGALRSPALWFGSILYILSFGSWLLILSFYPLSYAYPIAIGATLSFSTLFAILFFGESASLLKLAAIATIMAGIGLLGVSE